MGRSFTHWEELRTRRSLSKTRVEKELIIYDKGSGRRGESYSKTGIKRRNYSKTRVKRRN